MDKKKKKKTLIPYVFWGRQACWSWYWNSSNTIIKNPFSVTLWNCAINYFYNTTSVEHLYLKCSAYALKHTDETNLLRILFLIMQIFLIYYLIEKLFLDQKYIFTGNGCVGWYKNFQLVKIKIPLITLAFWCFMFWSSYIS